MAVLPSPKPKPPEAVGEYSLRDQFAMHIINGLLTSPMAQDQAWFSKNAPAMAYKIADAMIAESMKPTDTPVDWPGATPTS